MPVLKVYLGDRNGKMDDQPLQTLLTGFGPFATVVDNPTARLVEWFAGEPVAGHEITVCNLPTSFHRAPQLMDGALDTGGRNGRPFDVVLMMGVAQTSAGWRVERYGRNWNGAFADADGFAPQAGAPELAAARRRRKRATGMRTATW